MMGTSDRPTSALLLDMGGVVLDMAGGRGFPAGKADWRGRQALVRLIRARGGRVTMETLERELFEPWRRCYGKRMSTLREASWRPHLDRLRSNVGVDLEDGEILGAWFRPYAEQLRPLAGVRAALTELVGEGYRLALVSNVPLPGQHFREVLERLDLIRCFDNCWFSYDHDTRKPSPVMLRAALDALACEPSAAAMVGDRRDRDIAAGRAAGTATVWIRSAHAAGPAADHTIPGLGDLPALLRGE